MQNQRKDTIHAIQIIRGLASIFVVLDHAILEIIGEFSKSIEFNVKNLAFMLGDFGVYVFFILSGFIISYITPESMRPLSFIRGRIIRIVPLYYIGTALVIFYFYLIYFLHINKINHFINLNQIFLSLLFVTPQGDLSSPMRPILGQGWTLTFEMIFYALFSCCLLIRSRIRYLLLIVAIIGIVSVGMFNRPIWSSAPVRTWFDFYTSPLLLLFVLGIGLGLLRKWSNFRLRYATFFSTSLFLSSILIIMIYIWQPNYLNFGERLIFWGVAFFVIALASLENSKVNSGNQRVARSAEFLGNISYSTYLFHQFVLQTLFILFKLLHIKLPLAFILISVVLSVIVGWIINKYIEKPIIIFLNSRSFKFGRGIKNT